MKVSAKTFHSVEETPKIDAELLRAINRLSEAVSRSNANESVVAGVVALSNRVEQIVQGINMIKMPSSDPAQVDIQPLIAATQDVVAKISELHQAVASRPTSFEFDVRHDMAGRISKVIVKPENKK